MSTKDTLRFRSEAIFEEAELPKDRTRPLEWRRSFNTLRLDVRRPIVACTYNVNGTELLGKRGNAIDESKPEIAPDVKRRLAINARLGDDDCEDSVFNAAETERGSSIYRLVRPRGGIRLTLVSREPSEARLVYAAGAYDGAAFFVDYPPSEEGHICIELSAPLAFMEELVARLESDTSLGLSVHLAMHSFSYEVDDALREWYHARDLFIHGMAAAALVRITTVPPGGFSNDEERSLDVAAAPDSAKPARGTFQDAPSRSPDSLRSVKAALWVIAIVLTLQWLSSVS